MMRTDQPKSKLAQLARWENEGGSCPGVEVTVAAPDRKAKLTTDLLRVDASPKASPHGVRPQKKSTGQLCH